MSEYENVFKKQELYEIYTSGEAQALDDLCMIEDVALELQGLNKKIDFYKNYKRKRVKDVSDEIKVLENQVSFFKTVILSTLKRHKEKSVKFPGSCNVSSRNQAHKWVIVDEYQFVNILKQAKADGEDVDDVFEENITYDVKSKEASKLLDLWEKNGKLDEIINSNEGVIEKQAPRKICSISYPKVEEEEPEVDDSIPMKNMSEDDFDEI